MLRIRDKQIEAFASVAEDTFVRGVAEHLRDNYGKTIVRFPDNIITVSELTDEILHRLIRQSIARAREYGFTWESSITAFVAWRFVIAPNFDSHPLIRRALESSRTPTDASAQDASSTEGVLSKLPDSATSNDAEDARINSLRERTTEENWEAARLAYDAHDWQAS